MMHPTITEFNKTLEIMRKAYPFEDNDTRIVNTTDHYTASNTLIELATIDKSTGVEVHLSKRIEVEHENGFD